MEWSGAFVVKNFDSTSFSETCALMALVRPVLHRLSRVTKRSETPQNMSFGSNGVDRVGSLRKIQTRLCLANLRVNGTSSASFASTFCSNETVRNAPKHEFWVQ
jgi:hypothetical protein